MDSINHLSSGLERGSDIRLSDRHSRFPPYQQIDDIAYEEVAEVAGTINVATPSQNSVSADRSTNPPSHVLTQAKGTIQQEEVKQVRYVAARPTGSTPE